jgi:hypothetical protein
VAVTQLRLSLVVALSCAACSHTLEVKNLDLYRAPVRVGAEGLRPDVAVLPFAGSSDAMAYFNAIVERLAQSGTIGRLRTDYVALGTGEPPDLVVRITPEVTYRSSGWNFLINWPGFLIFTPAWNGYVYYADIVTKVVVYDSGGQLLLETSVPISYSIRQAEMDRTIFTGLTWLELSVLAFGGGIYNARVFDRDLIGALEIHVKDNYATYVMGSVGPRVAPAFEAAARAAAAAAAVAAQPPAASNDPNAPAAAPPVAAPPPSAPATAQPTQAEP